jgi:hypothetical protein
MPYKGKQYQACASNRSRILKAGYEPAWDCEGDKGKRSPKKRGRKRKKSIKKKIGGRTVYVSGKRKGKVYRGPRGGRYVIRGGKKVYF